MDGMSKDADRKIIEEALERFRVCRDREAEARAQSLEELKFSLGEQWPDAIKRARESDPNGARPCLTVDKLDQYVRQVVNDARQNKPGIIVRPKDSGADVETADVLQGLIRHVEDQSSADIAYDTGVEMTARCGFGFLRLVTDYCDDESFYQDLLIRPVTNPFSVYLGAHTQLDGSDADHGFAFEDVPRKQFEADYPKAEPVDFGDLGPGNDGWATEDTVRVCEYWRTETQPVKVWQGEDGKASEVEIPGALSRTIQRKKVVWRKITAAEVLETTEWPSRYLGIIPVYGHVIDVEGKRVWKGLCRPAMDAQRMYNYSASAFVERVALTPKAPFLVTAEQVEGYEHDWASANTSNAPYLAYNHIDNQPLPQRQPASDVPQGWMQVMQGMEHDIQGSLGMYSASIGAPSDAKSGKALLTKERQANASVFHFTDNLARAIRQLGRVAVDILPKLYDATRTARILGEDGSEEFVRIDPTLESARVDQQDAAGRKIASIYNIGVGRYDVTIKSGPSFSTKREAAAEFLTQVTQTAPQMLEIAGDLMFKALDMPYADEISKRMKKLLPAPLQEHPEGEEIPPEAQQKMQQMDQMVQQLTQALHDAHDKLEEASEKRETDERKMDIEAYKAETERMSALAAAITPEQVQQIAMQTVADMLSAPPLDHEASESPQYEMQEHQPMGDEYESPGEMPQDEQMQPPPGGFFTPTENDMPGEMPQ